MQWKSAMILLGLVAIPLINGFTVEMDTSQAPDLAGFGQQVKQLLEDWYPITVQLMYSPTFQEIDVLKVKFVENLGPPASADAFSNSVSGDAQFFRDRPDEIGAMIHEMGHCVQKYRGCPGWITEGITDWVRRWHFEPSQNRTRPEKPPADSNRDQQPVFFLNWLNERYPGIMYWLNRDCREEKYSEDRITNMTGKNTDQLWNDMMQS